MSLSGWRPAVVTSWSSRKRLPAFGPRLTTSSAEPGVNASTAPWCASVEKSVSVSGTEPVVVIVLVTSAPATATGRAAPQLAQNRLPAGFSVPQAVQNTRLAPHRAEIAIHGSILVEM